MPDNDHTFITAGKQKIGIIGLKSAIKELSDSLKDKTDEKIGSELLRKVSRKNYIPSAAEDDYKKAFVREFKKHLGIHVEYMPEDFLQIKIFGPGCHNCDLLEQRVYKVLSETGKEADVEHVTDIKAIAAAGILGTPALMINGKLKTSGAVPSKDRIKRWILEQFGTVGNIDKNVHPQGFSKVLIPLKGVLKIVQDL
ncbi:MAG: thioredoxin family protein [Desulfobulbaceae bacterium]|nr:thioredoxin family protein [Desulfobulbaceae bacterium]